MMELMERADPVFGARRRDAAAGVDAGTDACCVPEETAFMAAFGKTEEDEGSIDLDGLDALLDRLAGSFGDKTGEENADE